jgi:hypothetical protein
MALVQHGSSEVVVLMNTNKAGGSGSVVAGVLRGGITLYRSTAVSSGGVGNPPSIPCCIRGRRMPSRNLSQHSFESWTAMIVQPPAEEPAAWKIYASGKLPALG